MKNSSMPPLRVAHRWLALAVAVCSLAGGVGVRPVHNVRAGRAVLR